MRSAGGTRGGVGEFFIGLIMTCVGFYLLLNAISVHSSFNFATSLYAFPMLGSNFSITSGMVLVPFIFGIGMVFYNKVTLIGWALTIGSMSALIFGVIISLQFTLRNMSAFDLMVILVLCAGGLGLFLRALKKL